uniref:ATP synthase subunit gamma, mitochondrial n=1 Tax=Oryza barthii TaxID=65489 RepID=A0A0D3HC74_9ORYZ
MRHLRACAGVPSLLPSHPSTLSSQPLAATRAPGRKAARPPDRNAHRRPPGDCPTRRTFCFNTMRTRMKSVRNIQKITKAMKMVAASKLRAVQIRTENSRGLWQPFTALLGDVPSVDVKKNVIVAITSDKGLCGGINSTSVKVSKALHKLTSGPEKESKYVILGEKGKVQLIRDSKDNIEMTVSELQKNPINYTQIAVLADDILKNVEYDALRVVFNKFHSVISFKPTMTTILSPEVMEKESESGKVGDLDSYEIEGGETKSEILQNLTEFQFSCVMYNAALENACSELGARMSAMDSSSRNAVRTRMKSVRNIQKITKAMKMVAASKLRAVQIRTENSRGLWQPFTALLGDVPSVDVKKNVIVAITSDKGLCGGINSTSVKVSKALHKLTSGPEKESKYVILGEKGKVQLIRDSKDNIEMTVSELQKNPINYTQIAVLADDILKNVEYDALRVVFNKFHSVISFKPTMTTILSPEVMEKESESGKVGDLDSYEIEGGETKSEILQNLTEFQFSCVMYNAALENACSELGARMSAMDSSSRNAGEMLDRLTLTYNRTRQASITTELIEIISGASALEG